MKINSNDLILKTMTSIIAFILLGFSIYLFFAGHNAPGGGFIGGLMTSAAIVLMNMAYGQEAMKSSLPINFRFLFKLGLLIALATGMGSFLFNEPFLSQTFAYFQLPVLGRTELATALLFDLGVYLTVIGITMTIILSIAEDHKEELSE
ncbi:MULTISPECIES: Na(+)/H(+) antiporter subunit B [Salimicrobium]|uniref:Multicomponent Na+/H+ antiporter family protein subunit B n=3 Tax=Salimicrobium TaxID=351195 RepID=K2FPC4_9BACI|nr:MULTISPECIES: Na(+)/H(+) antiporter subunit B [Salimicrobium]AKG04500.1 Na(+)/H(+) antiporter subunit B [Salimicrobium jeotgali]EKE32711.1 multicomponent Na+/H+ antiporter family protein subunit B [Salimicrobium jeotgali]MBM7695303.1 monovalent cation:proton antiporter [Salimicrobium jeotgali]SDX28776.1 multicomponent Na+:H+ antiporter subunit B [Salimicrobium album]SIS65214.1 multisubunit sodium/proton antiporter, MrpB subunit [Salimicrobium salexigens]